ncbi:MAG: hypothetical protein OXU54_07065 [Gammaproteobacteria bacterium]|nr:hypothetical protein [Gammaproteobacteria bacterium]
MNEANKTAPSPRLSIQEGNLNDAEKQILHDFRHGWKKEDCAVPLVVSPKGSSVPEKPAEEQSKKDWQGAILRGSFLRDLFLENYCELDPREILISRAWIEGELNLSYCESQLPIFFENCVFSEGIRLISATIPGLRLAGCKICNLKNNRFKDTAINAMHVKVTTGVFLGEGFNTKGEVWLDGANIGGLLSCRSGYFENGLSAQRIKTGESVFLNEEFKAKGEVLLHGADIGGQLSCSGGHFENGLRAQSIKTDESVFLDEGFKAMGEVRLNGADIGRLLDCSDGHFENGINAMYISVKFSLILYGANIKGKVSLDNAEVGGEFQNMKTWSSENSCSTDGFRYQKINNYDDDGDDWKAGLRWLEHLRTSDKGNFFPQPYQQLMNAYHYMGHTNWAREIGFKLEKARSKEFKRGGLWYFWYFILRGTIGYGYRPFRFLWCAIALLLLGWLVFSIGHDGIVSLPNEKVPAFLENEWISSDRVAQADLIAEKGKKPMDYPPFNPFIYSLEATFPVLPLGQLDKWHPSNDWIRGIRYLWTVIGSMLLAILILFGVGALGPRWKGDDDSG